MSAYIDLKFIMMLSPRLDKFKKLRDNLFNFRCPYCGDSQKSQNKARGYFYRKKNDFFYRCHNCGKGTTFGKVLEYIDTLIYKEYVMERYKVMHQRQRHQSLTLRLLSLKKLIRS